MTLPLWNSQDIARVTHGRPQGKAFSVTGIAIDSRDVKPGDLFVALPGERDGHDFAGAALAAGATGILSAQDLPGPAVVTDNTLVALERLGLEARRRAPQARRIAVTGSVGKTSVTQAIAAALRLAGSSHSSVKSHNNHIGVPLTLARMAPNVRFAAFEAGMNHAGELDALSRMIQPHVAVVTTVGPVHVGNFKDGEAGVARAKAEIFEGLAPGGIAILDRDSLWFDLLSNAAQDCGAKVLSFGRCPEADLRLKSFDPDFDQGAALVHADYNGRELAFRVAQVGEHWGRNSLAVLLAADTVGAGIEAGVEALKVFQPLPGRGAEFEIGVPGGFALVIDDSYNANPLSVTGALKVHGQRPVAGRRIVALTDMLELGRDAAERHLALAQAVMEARTDLFFAAGPLMQGLYEALPDSIQGAWRESAETLAPVVCERLLGGDALLVKGSNGSKAATIAAALRAAACRRE